MDNCPILANFDIANMSTVTFKTSCFLCGGVYSFIFVSETGRKDTIELLFCFWNYLPKSDNIGINIGIFVFHSRLTFFSITVKPLFSKEHV